MATVSISANGSDLDGAVLENAATEETLVKLLSAIQSVSSSLNKINKSSGAKQGGETDPTQATLVNFDNNVKTANVGLNNLSRSMNLFSKSIVGAGGDLTNFAKKHN